MNEGDWRCGYTWTHALPLGSVSKGHHQKYPRQMVKIQSQNHKLVKKREYNDLFNE